MRRVPSVHCSLAHVVLFCLFAGACCAVKDQEAGRPAAWGAQHPLRLVEDPVATLRAALATDLMITASRKGRTSPFRREEGEGVEIVLGTKTEGSPIYAKLDPNYVELHVMAAGYAGRPVIDSDDLIQSPRGGIADVVAVGRDGTVYAWGNDEIARKAAVVLLVPVR